MPVVQDAEEREEAKESQRRPWAQQNDVEYTYNAIKLKDSTACSRGLLEWVQSLAVKATATIQRWEKMTLNSRTCLLPMKNAAR